MSNYNVNKTYNETMTQLQTTDKVHADTFNPMFNQLLNNDSYFNASLADIPTVSALSYGVSTANSDNHSAIMSAIADVFSKGGGTIEFPAGLFKTSPISLNGYNSIKFKGVGVSKPWKTVTTIQFIASGDVGLQFADSTNPNPTWNATNCKVEGIFFDGNNNVNACINGNYDLEITTCTFRHALQDGIRFEDLTYPIYLDKVESSYNGRHGLYVRGGQTTKYNVYRSNFDNNNGYGIYLEAGASVTFLDCLTQSNKQGGVKLNWIGNSYPNGYYLQDILFINHYWENNGLLATNDPNYDGNFALVINTTDTTSAANKKANGIRFLGGEMNTGASSGTYKIVGVFGLSFEHINIDHSKGSIPTPSACFAMTSSVGASSAANSAQAPYPFVTSYGQADNGKDVLQIFKHGGVIGSRGRSQLLVFYVSNISAGQSVLMTPASFGGVTGMPLGIPQFQRTTLLAAAIHKRYSGGTRAGTLTAQFTYDYVTYGNDPNTVYSSFPTLTLTPATTNFNSAQYTPLQYAFTSDIWGIKLTASSDYVPGSDTGVVVYVLVES